MSAPALGWLTWAAMLAVLAAAAVLSFDALRDLAVLCGVDPRLAWLLPICVDAGAAISTRIWLDGRAVLAERFARRMTYAMLAVTVAGNALHSGLVASDLTPTWWTAVLVGAVPPVVVGATVHLAVLVGRPATSRRHTAPAPTANRPGGAGPLTDDVGSTPVPPPAQRPETAPARNGERSTTAGAPAPDSDQAQPGPTVDNRTLSLIREGAGRRRLARELGVTEHQARELLAESRNGHDREVAR